MLVVLNKMKHSLHVRSDFIYDMLDNMKKKEDPNTNAKRSKKPKKPTVSSQFKVSGGYMVTC